MSADDMRLVVNASQLVLGGGLVVGKNLLMAIRRVSPGLELLAVIPPHRGYEELCAMHGIESTVLTPKRPRQMWRVYADNVVIPRLARRWGADAVFALGNSGPLKPRLPHAILLQNALLVFGSRGIPGWTLRNHAALALQSLLFRIAAANSVLVFPQTKTVAEGLVAKAGVPFSKIRVVPNAVNDVQEQSRCDEDLFRRIIDRAGGRLTLLLLAHYYPHKNFDYLIDVAQALEPEEQRRVMFVVTIGTDQHRDAAPFLQRVKDAGLSEVIVNVGPVRPGQLSALYTATDGIFFPSLAESFSTTYLEAMAYRRPILTSDLAFARECCEDAAMYFDPRDPRSGADAVRRFEEDAGLRTEMAARSAAQLRRQPAMNWDDVATKYLTAIHDVLRPPTSVTRVSTP